MDVNKIPGITNHAFIFVQEVSYVYGVKAKMDALEGNMETVSTKKADIGDQAEQEQGRPEKKRKEKLTFGCREQYRWRIKSMS